MSPTAEPAIMSGKTRVLGSITVIDTPLVTRAMDYARTHSEPFLFNHAVRSWLFAVRLGQLQGTAHDAEVVAVGSLLHDLGLTNSFTGQKRFEIEGADAARAFAREQASTTPGCS
jgi:HD superfamily phosphodiesterase